MGNSKWGIPAFSRGIILCERLLSFCISYLYVDRLGIVVILMIKKLRSFAVVEELRHIFRSVVLVD